MKVQIVCDHCPWKAPEQCELTPDMIGMACPDCGETVVDERDFGLSKILKLFEELGLIKTGPEPGHSLEPGYIRQQIRSRDLK